MCLVVYVYDCDHFLYFTQLYTIGVEFLMPLEAIYCRLCKVFTGGSTCAEDHMKSDEHNATYRVWILADIKKLKLLAILFVVNKCLYIPINYFLD